MWGEGGLVLVLALVAGGGEQSEPKLRHLARPGPARNLRSSASVRQHLDKGIPNKGRNELAGKREGRELLSTMSQGTQAQASTESSHQPLNATPPIPTSATTSVS